MADGSLLEIRVLDLAADRFTTRIPLGYIDTHGDILRMELSFFLWEKKDYETVCVKSFSMESCTCRYWQEICFCIFSKEFAELSKRLTKEYLHYVDCRLNMSDDELAAEFTNYPSNEDDKYAEKTDIQIRKFARNDFRGTYSPESLKKIQWGLALEKRSDIEEFLSSDLKRVVKKRFEKAGYQKHPFSEIKPKFIYVGNSFCTNLRPSVDTVKKVYDKALNEGCRAIAVIAPVDESRYDAAVEYIDRLIDKGICEFSANDIGICRYINETGKAKASKGVLLYKNKRDPRTEYLSDLRSQCIMATDTEVFFPFYQTNTGTFCPLYAAAVNGDRGRQQGNIECGYICERTEFLYPEKMKLFGRFNSLFGYNEDFLNKPDVLFSCLGDRRAVINL